MSFLLWWRTYAKAAIESAWNAKFYREAHRRSFGEAFGHVMILIAVFTLLPFMVSFFLGMRDAIAHVTDAIRREIPAGTVFEVKDGRFTNSLEAPIVKDRPEGLFVLNTATTTLQVDPMRDGLEINSEGIVLQDDGRRDLVPFRILGSFKATHEQLIDGLSRWAPLAMFLGSLLAVAIVGASLALLYVLMAAMHAVILVFLLRVYAKAKWTYRQAFVAALYAATLPMLLRVILPALRVDPGMLPTAAYWLLLASILYDQRSLAASSSTPSSQGAADEQT